MTYEIFETNLKALLEKLAKFNAKLARIGAAPATVKVVGQKDVPRFDEPTLIDRVMLVELATETPVSNGWQFVAKIVHTPEGNIVNHVPGTGELPVGYREGKPCCDHCKTNRFRRDTYIVRKENSTQQVGSSCLEEFLGTKTPQMLCAAMECVLDMHDLCDTSSKLSRPLDRNVARIPLATYLAHVAQLVIDDGDYMTRSQAKAKGNGDLATSRRAYTRMFDYIPNGVVPPQRYTVTEEAINLADIARNFVIDKFAPAIPDMTAPGADVKAAIMSHFSAQAGLSDFEHNLYTLAKSESIEARLGGIAAYIVQFYRRANPVKHVIPQLNEAGMPRIFAIFTNAATQLKHPAIRLADEAGTRLHLSLAGKASKNAGCIYVKQASGFDAPYYGKITADGRFLSVRGCPATVEALLLTFAADPEGVAAKYGKLTGNCCFCGHTLKDERSTTVGYGPVCADKFGLNWGSRKHDKVEQAAISNAEAAAAAM